MKPRVLVVEDSLVVQRVLARLLDGFAEVTAVTTALDALAAYRAQPFDAVVTDVLLNGKTGLDLLAELRAIDPSAAVVVITGNGSLDLATRALGAGAVAFVLKPDLRHAVDRVRYAVAERRGSLPFVPA